jgi:uncharacterized protein (TIGR00369 family)
MNKNNVFLQIMDGRVPLPECAKTLGTKFTKVDADAGTLEVEFEGKKEFLNPVGNIQGGFLAAMLDDTLGPALVATLDEGEFAPTLNLNIQFHRPGKIGKFTGNGRVVTRGRDICHLAGELMQDGKIVATATATAAIRKL